MKIPKMKKKKASSGSGSPAPEPDTTTLVSSSEHSRQNGRTDEDREARQRERAERRRQREKRNEDIRSEHTSKSKKKDKPKLSQEERDVRDAKLGCCHRFAQILVKIIHFLDFAIGLAFFIYGGVIYENFDQPAMEAVITSVTYGSVLVFASMVGGISFSFSACKRCGLALSAWAAAFIAFFYIFVMILLAGDTIFNYLDEHKDVMYLNDAEIATLKKMLPFFYIALACLAAIEICRFFVLHKLRKRLIQYDGAQSRMMKRNTNNLAEPLLNDGPNIV